MSKEKLNYDPNAKYTWNVQTEFSLNGNEFGLILNTFRRILSDPESQKILVMNKANDVMEEVLKRNVENGNVKPVEIPEENSAPMQAVKEDNK